MLKKQNSELSTKSFSMSLDVNGKRLSYWKGLERVNVFARLMILLSLSGASPNPKDYISPRIELNWFIVSSDRCFENIYPQYISSVHIL
jgi:hypothetical protein